jgi:Zn-dependent M28 family amino/carboxypeptidase
MGVTTLSIRNTGGTDHLSFDRVGLPGFQFIQDEIEYNSRTHHSNMDVYDRIQRGDMMQAAVVMASLVYQTAIRDEKLPRKPMNRRRLHPLPVTAIEFGTTERAENRDEARRRIAPTIRPLPAG